MTIKYKLTLMIVLVFLIVAAILGYFFLSSMHTSLFVSANEKTAEKATESAHVMAQLLDVRLNAVRSLAEFLGEHATANNLDEKIPNLEYSLKLSDYEYYAVLWYNNWHHATRTTFGRQQPIVGYAGMPGRAVFGKLYKNEIEGLLLQQYIFDDDGNEIGRLVAKLSAHKFWSDIASAEKLKSDDILVSKHLGNILYPSKYSGGKVTGAVLGKLGDAQISVDGNDIPVKCLSIPVTNAQLDITAVVDVDDTMAQYNRIVLLFFVIIGSSLLLIGAFVHFISSRMTRSITELSRYVSKMGPDCGSIPEVFTSRSDEAGKLANSFSLLLARLNAAMDEADYTARHDSLTLLNNRFCLESEISDLIGTQQPFAFALLDVDDFKIINDSKGHDEGDRLLKDLASVFRTFMPSELAVYRWGGDEFALIIFGDTMAQYKNVLAQLMERVDNHFRDAGDSRITVSIGVCVYPAFAVNYKNLLINADKALAFAKMSGKVKFCFYEQL